MNPVVLEDGRWFDADHATQWDREFEYDPSESGSLARQVLWRTKRGAFILEHWTYNSWEGSEDLYKRESIPEEVGIVWLLSANKDVPEDLLQKVREIEL